MAQCPIRYPYRRKIILNGVYASDGSVGPHLAGSRAPDTSSVRFREGAAKSVGFLKRREDPNWSFELC